MIAQPYVLACPCIEKVQERMYVFSGTPGIAPILFGDRIAEHNSPALTVQQARQLLGSDCYCRW